MDRQLGPFGWTFHDNTLSLHQEARAARNHSPTKPCQYIFVRSAVNNHGAGLLSWPESSAPHRSIGWPLHAKTRPVRASEICRMSSAFSGQPTVAERCCNTDTKCSKWTSSAAGKYRRRKGHTNQKHLISVIGACAWLS